jgi:tryptophanyl-tRNA synthetase
MKILTGIRPTNTLHIGNLFGSLKPMVELQEGNEMYMMIADYHSIGGHNPDELKKNIRFATAAYLAAGIDPTKTVVFQQSQVPAHTEAAWMLQSITHMGEANRMTQFKDKSGGKVEAIPVSLFTYPILMAADILLYGTQSVPVGDDQKQHVELTRDLAERFNKQFGETFVVPEPMIGKKGARIRALNEPEKKMSKSAPSAKNYISLMDSEEIIHKKIRSAVTDSEPAITFDPERLGLHNLLTIFSLSTGDPADEIAARYEGKGMKDLKDDLAEALNAYLAPMREKIDHYLKDPAELERIIQNGSAAASRVANVTLAKMRKNIGVSL